MEDVISFIIFVLIFGVITIMRIVKATNAQNAGERKSEEESWGEWQPLQQPPAGRQTPPPAASAVRSAVQRPAAMTQQTIQVKKKAPPAVPVQAVRLQQMEVGSREQETYNFHSLGDKTEQELITESLSRAFPEAVRQVRNLRPGIRRPIRIRISGRTDLRRAVLMSEVLGPPRAFDV